MSTDEKIINLFKKHKDNYLSGEELSGILGVSRTAVWKHIENLREEGYDIAASPHLGYKLITVPDRLTSTELKSGLKTKLVGKKIYSFMEISSTNDTAYALALEGAREGTVVAAEYQTKGKGRLGRKWISPKSKGAYFSIVLRPEILPRELSVITLLASLAIAKGMRQMTGLPALIKWPNDILVNGKKLCGILTELNGEADKINFVILGIGININTRTELLPDTAGSVAEEKGERVSRIDLVKRVLENIDILYGRFKRDSGVESLLEEYKRLSAVLDRHVKISYHDKSVSGLAVDIDKDGALLLRNDSGFTERVLAGDVAMLR